MPKSVKLGSDDFDIKPVAADGPPADVPTTVHDHQFAHENDPAMRQALKDAYGDAVDVKRIPSNKLAGKFAAAAEEGRYALEPQGVAVAMGEGEDSPPEPVKAAEKEITKGSVHFLVVDHLTGEPIDNVQLSVKLPDGVEKTGKTSGGKHLTYANVNTRGQCELSGDPKPSDTEGQGELSSEPKPLDRMQLLFIEKIDHYPDGDAVSIDKKEKKRLARRASEAPLSPLVFLKRKDAELKVEQFRIVEAPKTTLNNVAADQQSQVISFNGLEGKLSEKAGLDKKLFGETPVRLLPKKWVAKRLPAKGTHIIRVLWEPLYFSIVVMPDTQYYTRPYLTVFNAQFGPAQRHYKKQSKWIADHKYKYRIKSVLHLGDIVDSHDEELYDRYEGAWKRSPQYRAQRKREKELAKQQKQQPPAKEKHAPPTATQRWLVANRAEWDVAKECMGLLDKAAIPYLLATGNHDYRGNGKRYFDKHDETGNRTADGVMRTLPKVKGINWEERKLRRYRRTLLNEYFKSEKLAKSFAEQGVKLRTFDGCPDCYDKKTVPSPSCPTCRGTPAKGNLETHCLEFEVFGTKLFLVSLEWAPRKGAVKWVDEQLTKAAKASRRAILVTHDYMNRNNKLHKAGEKYSATCKKYRLRDVYAGDKLWAELVSKHSNLLLVFNGHVLGPHSLSEKPGTWREALGKTSEGDVHQMLVDYQTLPQGGLGFLRLARFLQDGEHVLVESYSPSELAQRLGTRIRYPKKQTARIKDVPIWEDGKFKKKEFDIAYWKPKENPSETFENLTVAFKKDDKHTFTLKLKGDQKKLKPWGKP